MLKSEDLLFEQLDDKVANRHETGTCFAAQSIYEHVHRGDGRNKLGAAAIVEGLKKSQRPIGRGMDAGEGGRTITFLTEKKNNLLNYKANTHVSSLRIRIRSCV